MKVSLFCPVRQDADCLALSLTAHRALKGVERRVYVDDNTDVRSSELLLQEAAGSPGVTVLKPAPSEEAAYVNHTWTQEALSRIAEIRNQGIANFLTEDYDAMFTVDADTIVHPETVHHMAAVGKPIVGGVHWSKWPGCDFWLPNTWEFHPYGFKSNESIIALKAAGLMRVAGNGGCNIIQRGVFEAGVNYTPVWALRRICWGEDRWISIRAEAHGFEIWADSDYPPFHVYTPDLLAEAKQWWADGAHPGYFRKYWLTQKWEDEVRRYKQL